MLNGVDIMTFDLERARTLVNLLNEKLRPMAEAPVDVNDPSWAEQLRQSKPLDELGIVSEIAGPCDASLADMLRRMG